MDIKLRRYNIVLKMIALLLASATVCALAALFMVYKEQFENVYVRDALLAKDYLNSAEYNNEVSDISYYMGVISTYESEKNILNKDSELTKYLLNDAKDQLFYSYQDDIYEKLESLDLEGEITETMQRKEFEKGYQDEIQKNEQNIIDDALERFRFAVSQIKENPNIVYTIKTGKTYFANTKLTYQEILNQPYSQYDYGHDIIDRGDETSGSFAYYFNKNYIGGKITEFTVVKSQVTNFVIFGFLLFLIFLLCLVYLIFAAGKKESQPEGIHHLFIDKLYNEFTAALLFGACVLVFYCFAMVYYEIINRNFDLLLLGLSVVITIEIVLMLVRHIKSKTLLKNTLIYSLLSKIVKFFKGIYALGNPMLKTMMALIVLAVLTMIPFVGFITLPIGLYFAYHQAKKYIKLKEGIRRIKSGVYNEKIELSGMGEFAVLADDINDVSAGLSDEVERRMKSERLKTELIVNVSHDIKTPLTSVITYVDLLKKEETENENIKNYVDVIDKKADRLKILIDDLFEASKAASGNINVNFEKVDVVSLLTQGMGELNDRIEQSGLEFILNMSQTRVLGWADGRLLWRVVENLLSNVFKYSLPKSRVYIDVYENERDAFVEIKNISAEPLNIPADELTERFKRGDLSRNSEGSGLGLDIARSLMICQTGELGITVDGDLFKAKLKINKPL